MLLPISCCETTSWASVSQYWCSYCCPGCLLLWVSPGCHAFIFHSLPFDFVESHGDLDGWVLCSLDSSNNMESQIDDRVCLWPSHLREKISRLQSVLVWWAIYVFVWRTHILKVGGKISYCKLNRTFTERPWSQLLLILSVSFTNPRIFILAILNSQFTSPVTGIKLYHLQVNKDKVHI